MAPQFNPSSVAQPVPTASIGSSNSRKEAVKADEAKPVEKAMAAGSTQPNANGVADPLGDARSKVQEEIGREFAAIMATGTLRASEAAALATKKVMQKYGHATLSQG